MSANESTSDRAIRILFGAALVSLVFFGPQSAWGWLGLIPIVTGLVGFCPLYRLFGIDACRVKHNPHPYGT